MAKGMFTQGAVVLLDRPVSLDAIEAALPDFEIRNRIDPNEQWAFGGPTLLVDYRVEVNGIVLVDVIDCPWPDHMGNVNNDPIILGAWSMGFFGPFTYPGGLQRAAGQCWTWEMGKSVLERHQAFIRIRCSYAFGDDDQAWVMPTRSEALPELQFVTRLASSLLDLPEAICYFNPNGEILRDRNGLRESIDHGVANDVPSLDAWSNVRMFKVDAEWFLMDTVGNGQFDVPDVEACFHTESYEPQQVDKFLRDVSLYILTNGEVIKDGDTMDGPGGIRWQSRSFDNGICDPPRRVLRWLPMDGRSVPSQILNAGDAD